MLTNYYRAAWNADAV